MPATDPKAYAKIHYAKNKAKYRDRLRDRRKKGREHVVADKKCRSCERCGFADYRALCYHHTNPHNKVRDVWDMAGRGFAIATIQKEMNKCMVLCANCHAIEHFADSRPQTSKPIKSKN